MTKKNENNILSVDIYTHADSNLISRIARHKSQYFPLGNYIHVSSKGKTMRYTLIGIFKYFSYMENEFGMYFFEYVRTFTNHRKSAVFMRAI
jgi:hypothetical protein